MMRIQNHSVSGWRGVILLIYTLFFFIAITINVNGSDVAPVDYTISFSQAELSFSKLNGYDLIGLDDGDYFSGKGQPMLPAREIKIALPSGMRVQSVRVVDFEIEEIMGDYHILPAQPPQKTDLSEKLFFIDPIPEIYKSVAPFPSQPVELVSQVDLAGQAMAVIRVYPIQYIPADEKLYLYTSLRFSLEGVDGYVCGDYLPENVSDKGRRTYEQMLSSMVVNRESISLTGNPLGFRQTALLSGGPFEHVIITSDSYASLYQPLVDWHTRKGVRDTVVTTSYIYANYSGSDNQQKIRNFVIDAHNNWNTLYILIGGENSTVPFEYRTYDGDNIPSDQYYGDFDDDWVYEVQVGRVTAESAAQISCFMDKLLLYETNPPLDNFALDVCLLGMDLTLATQPPYYTLTASEDIKESIIVNYLPSHLNITSVFDSEPDNHKNKFVNALNAGQNLVNHSDHSNYNVMGTGDLNHGSFLYISNVNGLTNNGRLSNIFSLGCHPLELDHNDCIGEYFVIFNELQAGVSFTGNTRSGWFYVGIPISLSGKLDLYWWRAIFDYNQYRLGEALAWTKQNNPHTGDWPYSQWTLNLLGDPEMPLWTDTIRGMIVTHPDNFPVEPSSFSVHVEDSSTNPVVSAYVCLWKGEEIYERGYTDAGGNISLDLTPASHGDMLVTVTAQNFVPYQGTVECVGNLPPVADFTFDPLTPTRHDDILFNSSSYDNDGTLVNWLWDFGDDSTASGEQATHRYENYNSYMVTLIVEDDGGAADTIQSEVLVEPLCGDINDDNSGPNVADLTYLVDFLFNSGPPPPATTAADVDGSSGINVADLTYLVDFLFGNGPDLICQ